MKKRFNKLTIKEAQKLIPEDIILTSTNKKHWPKAKNVWLEYLFDINNFNFCEIK